MSRKRVERIERSGGAPATAAGLRRNRGVGALVICLLVLAGAYAGALLTLRPVAKGAELSVDELMTDARSHGITSAQFLDEDARITGTQTPQQGGTPTDFWTAYPRSDAATNDLLTTLVSNGARVTVDSQTGKAIVRFVAQFLLPLMILANLFALLFVLVRGGGSGDIADLLQFGRVGRRAVRQGDRSTITFADVAAAEEAVAELAEVRDYLAAPAAFEAIGAVPPRGILLVGPPGCGKTLLARAVAGEAAASFHSISGSEFVESLVGIGAARVRDLFSQARASTPAIIFIDELDAVGRQRGTGLGGGHDEREQTLNELLVQMDGFSPTEGIVVIGASNRPDILDPALLRAGRFERRITVERPDVHGRLEILKLHARRKRLRDPEADLPHIARRTPGFSGADLAGLLNEAALLAVRKATPAIDRPLLDEGIERVLSGPRRRAKVISPEEKRRIACHEAGHAVVAAALGRAQAVERVSIIARGRGVGHLALLQEEKTVLTRQEMQDHIAVAMAGVAAEEMLLGQPSTGSEQDLERATNTARDMAGRYGMSARLGRVRVLRDHREVFLGRDYLASGDVSQPTLEHLDAEVRTILDAEEARARRVLESERGAVEALAGALALAETVEGPDLDAILEGVRPTLRVTEDGATPTFSFPGSV